MANKKTNYREILKESGYRKLLVSTLVNRFGDSLDAVAFTWLVYQATHSGAWSAVIFGLNILPNVIVQPFAGAYVERLNKKNVIVFTHILRAVLLINFLIVFVSGNVNGWIMAAFTIAVSSIESFNMPAATAFIPKVVKKDKLTHAMSFNTMMSGAVTMIGTALAGVMIAKAGLYSVMITDTATFFIAAFIVLTIDYDAQDEDSNSISKESYLMTLKEGIRYIRSEPVIINYCIVAVMLNLLLVPINALQAPLVSECFRMDSGLLSVIGVAGSIGAILGASLIPLVSARLSVKKIVIYLGLILGSGIVILPMAGGYLQTASLKYLAAAICFVIMTLSAGLITGVVNIEFVSNVDQRYLARSSAVFVALATASIPVTSMIVGILKTYLETSTLIILCGVSTILFILMLMIADPALDMKKGRLDATETA